MCIGKESIIQEVEENRESLIKIAKSIWENPEIGYNEHFASKLQSDYLKEQGFEINFVEGMETAFIAQYGSGKPVIGILGEYDALPGLSQRVCTHREAVIEDGVGHGCGHNLLGTAGLGAVTALKTLMEKENIKGTIRYYGCPAEEGGAGKVNMGKRGVFKDVDCALTWHPFDINTPIRCGMLSNFSVRFRFKGKAAHAAQAPYNGRSALDGVELMNTGTNYLREHLIDSIRIHYIITNGGDRPNIVPDFSEVWYYVRGKRAEDVREAFHRVVNVAKGAALMTGTHMDYKILSAIYDFYPNDVLTDVIFENLSLVGAPKHSEEDEKFAKKLGETFTEDERLSVAEGLSEDDNIIEEYVHEEVSDLKNGKHHCLSCSSDVGDVSHMVPTAQLSVGAWPIGTAAHTWQSCSASGSNLGFSAMLVASKVLACSAYDLLRKKELVEEAKEEYKKDMKNFEYVPLMETIEIE